MKLRPAGHLRGWSPGMSSGHKGRPAHREPPVCKDLLVSRVQPDPPVRKGFLVFRVRLDRPVRRESPASKVPLAHRG
jgi:hypothetical protein